MIRLLLCIILTPVSLLAAEPDPSAAVVASGNQVYRLRDVDALLAIARRHAGKDPIDESLLRAAIVSALTAREPFLSALVTLPMSGPARDRFVLDLLDYHGEPNAGIPPAEDSPTSEPVVSTTRAVIVALPALSLPRTIAGTRWVLSAEFALRFADRTAANAAEDSAALIRDAIRGYLQGLSPEAFTTPDQPAMKQELGAILAKQLPGFTIDDLLIPALDCAPHQP